MKDELIAIQVKFNKLLVTAIKSSKTNQKRKNSWRIMAKEKSKTNILIRG